MIRTFMAALWFVAVLAAAGCKGTSDSSQPQVACSGISVGSLSLTTSEDTRLEFVLPVKTTPPDASVTIAASIETAHGTLKLVNAARRVMAYIPSANYSGTDTLQISVGCGADEKKLSGTMNIAPVNDPPTPLAEIRSTAEDTPISFDVTVSDVDGAVAWILVPGGTSGVSENAAGKLAFALQDGVVHFDYFPALNFHGNGTFPLALIDNNGASASGEIRLAVAPIDDPPTLTGVPMTITVESGASSKHCIDGSDPDGPVAFSLNPNPTFGAITWDSEAPNCFTFQARGDAAGVESVEVKVHQVAVPLVVRSGTLHLIVTTPGIRYFPRTGLADSMRLEPGFFGGFGAFPRLVVGGALFGYFSDTQSRWLTGQLPHWDSLVSVSAVDGRDVYFGTQTMLAEGSSTAIVSPGQIRKWVVCGTCTQPLGTGGWASAGVNPMSIVAQDDAYQQSEGRWQLNSPSAHYGIGGSLAVRNGFVALGAPLTNGSAGTVRGSSPFSEPNTRLLGQSVGTDGISVIAGAMSHEASAQPLAVIHKLSQSNVLVPRLSGHLLRAPDRTYDIGEKRQCAEQVAINENVAVLMVRQDGCNVQLPGRPGAVIATFSRNAEGGLSAPQFLDSGAVLGLTLTWMSNFLYVTLHDGNLVVVSTLDRALRVDKYVRNEQGRWERAKFWIARGTRLRQQASIQSGVLRLPGDDSFVEIVL